MARATTTMPVERIAADWLLEGVQRCALLRGPPTGYEFGGLVLEPGVDPVPELWAALEAPRLAVAMQTALVHTLADHSMFRTRLAFADEVMLTLVRLCDYFGSPRATVIILGKVERGEFVQASPELADCLAALGARQAPDLRRRFEDGMRRSEGRLWQPKHALAFLREEVDESPHLWLDLAHQRYDDLESLDRGGLNALALILGAACADGRDEQILVGLASGTPDEHARLMKLLFSAGIPHASLAMVEGTVSVTTLRDREFEVTLTIDDYSRVMRMANLLSLRSQATGLSPFDAIEADEARLRLCSAWGETLVSIMQSNVRRRAA